MPAAGCQSLPSPATVAGVYRPRRPAATLLHRVVREHIETYLATATGNDKHGRGVPPHIEAAFREYLKCGILAHGFARVFWAKCHHDFMVTTIRQRSPGAPSDARFGAVAFVHRFGSYLNNHVHFHVLVSDGVFSAGTDGAAIFHPALDLPWADFVAVQSQMRRRGLRWLQRLARYCTRPPLSQERLGRLNDQLLVYNLRRATADGRTELLLTPEELLDRLAQLVPSPRIHKHRTCGVLAPNARLRRAVTASAGPAGATLLLLQQARAEMGLPSAYAPAPPPSPRPASAWRRPASGRCCWRGSTNVSP